MAIYKLGAFITAIVGSIGGTNFRRGVGSPIIGNKSFGTSNTRLRKNPQLNPIGNIFRRWKLLSDQQRSDWNAAATDFSFADKFGDPKFLTGRQLFTKTNIQLLPVNSSLDDPAGFTSDIPAFLIYGSTIKSNKTEANITFENFGDNAWFLVQAEIKLGNILTPSFTKRYTFYYSQAEGENTFEMFDELFPYYPQFGPGYSCVYYLTAMNLFGFKSQTLFSYPDIDPD